MSSGNTTERKGIFGVSTSPNVRVDRIPVKNRVLVAQKEFQPGDELFSVDAVLSVTRDGCIACGDKRCLTYCDRFRRYFLEVRPSLNAANTIAKTTGTPVDHVRMAIKWIALRQSTLALPHKPTHEALDAIFELNNHRDGKEDREQDRTTADKIIATLPVSHKEVLKADKLADFLGIIYTNAHHIPGMGIGLFPVASMIEHSCAPNSVYEVVNDKMTLTAITKISKGDAITLSYIKPYQPRGDRQAELRARYYFDCVCFMCSFDLFNRDLARAFRCKKCEDGIVTPLNLGLELSDWKCEKCDQAPTSEAFQEMIAEENMIKGLDLLDVPVESLLESSTLHRTHYLIYRALESRVKVLARLRPNLAQNWLLILLEGAKRVLPEFHPDKAVFLDMLGQVRKLLSDIKGAKEAFNDAWQLREKTNGKNSAITAQAKTKRDNPERVDITLLTTY